MNHELQELERELAALKPVRVPARLLQRIEAGVAALPDPARTKVVPFPAGARREARAGALPRWFPAAAAVALLGATAAVFAPVQKRESSSAAGAMANAAPGWTAPARGSVHPAVTGFKPAAARAGVREVRDEGLVWSAKDKQPMRRVRVVYFERVTMTNPAGEKLEVEMPRVEYILLPEKFQ